MVFSLVFIPSSGCFSQHIADPCFNSISPTGKFYGSDDIVNLCGYCSDNFQGANFLEWNGSEWVGQLPYSHVKRPPPEGCNVRAIWLGYDGWTPGGEAVALRFNEPIQAGRFYSFTFTYAVDGRNRYDLDSTLTFAPIIYTSKNRPYYIYESYKIGKLPATIDWTTQSISFKATQNQDGHQWLIVHGYETSGSILSNCMIKKPLDDMRNSTDTTLCFGNELELNALKNSNYEYSWSTGTTESSIVISESGTYSVFIKNHACESTASATVHFEDCDPRMTMPSIFTPNGDSYNEVFIPMEYNYIESGTVVIYNRWGGEVYSGDIFAGWSGMDSAAGIYFYRIRYKAKNEAIYEQRGTVTLLR